MYCTIHADLSHLLFAYGINRFSHDVALILIEMILMMEHLSGSSCAETKLLTCMPHKCNINRMLIGLYDINPQTETRTECHKQNKSLHTVNDK